MQVLHNTFEVIFYKRSRSLSSRTFEMPVLSSGELLPKSSTDGVKPWSHNYTIPSKMSIWGRYSVCVSEKKNITLADIAFIKQNVRLNVSNSPQKIVQQLGKTCK